MYKVTFEDRELSVDLEAPGSAIIDGNAVQYDMESVEKDCWNVIANHKSYNVRLIERNDIEKTMTLLVNNRSYTVSLRDRFDELLDKMGMSVGAGAQLNELKAPMPGLVVDVITTPGSAVEKGETLLILEAMKMENVIKAAGTSTVKALHIVKGQTVEKNQLLISFE